tara:strand:+ start:367 stop:552 length:186 start_codon:yes stop_codon:yes gene_type:complete
MSVFYILWCSCFRSNIFEKGSFFDISAAIVPRIDFSLTGIEILPKVIPFKNLPKILFIIVR